MHARAQGLATQLVEIVAGTPPTPLPVVWRDPEAPLDDDARADAAAERQSATLVARVTAACALDTVDVLVADGSTMTLEAATRALEGREETAPYATLRDAIRQAQAPAARALRESCAATFGDVETTKASSAHRAILVDALRATEPLRDAAREVLAMLGKATLEDPRGLERALDMPASTGAFAEPTLLALTRAMRDAAAPWLVRPLRRWNVPRAMQGIVVSAAPGPVLIGNVSCRRAEAFAALVTASATGVLLGCTQEERLTARAAACANALARGLALGITSAPVRRAITDAPRRDAENAARIGAAIELLTLRGHAARALLAGHGSLERDGLREALAKAWGTTPGDALLDAWSVVSWPGGPAVSGATDALLAEAVARARAPGIAAALRDAHDESFALSEGFFARLEPLRDAWASDEATLVDALGLAPVGTGIAQFMGEALH